MSRRGQARSPKPDPDADSVAQKNSAALPDAKSSHRMAIAGRLRTARELAGLSQGQAARLLDLHRPAISEAEAGRRRVSADEMSILAAHYGVSTSWLVGSDSDVTDIRQGRIELAARELGKLKPEDIDRVLNLLMVLRADQGTER